MTKLPAVLVDIDGTLVDVTSIRHHVEGSKRDFDSFHRASLDCPPHVPVIQRLESLKSAGTVVIAISGREERFRRLTDFWLAMWDVPCDDLHMRPTGDRRADVVFKRELFERLSLVFDVREVIDDSGPLLEMWAQMNVPSVVDVHKLLISKSEG